MNKTYELSYTAEHIDELLGKVDEGTVYQDASTQQHGLMSATDKSKLDALPTAQQIDGALNDKVDKVEGKGLSENDYTDAEKEAVASAYQKPQSGIPKTDLATDVQTSLGKADTALQSEQDPTVPSWAKQPNKPSYNYIEIGNTPDLSGFVTKSVNDLANYYLKSETYTKAEVQELINAVKQFTYESVASLPTASSDTMHKIYLVPSADPQTSNVKDEYITIESSGSYSWEQIGSTAIDLSGYVTTSALNTALADYTTTSNLTALLSNKADKVSNATNGNFAGLDANGNLTDSGKKASDFATAAQGAKADTAYQRPQAGIPESDLSSDVQQALQKHFKGWWPDLATLKAAHTAEEGDSAYVKDASPATTWSIYIFDATATSDNFWADSGTDADTTNVQTFASDEEVNETYIDDTNLVNPKDGALAKAEDALQLSAKLSSVDANEEKFTSSGAAKGYFDTSTKTVVYNENSNSYCVVIDVIGCKKVRFLAQFGTASTTMGFGFGILDNGVFVARDSEAYGTTSDQSGRQLVTYERFVPVYATHIAITLRFFSSNNLLTLDNFYGYKFYGASANMIVEDMNLAALSAYKMTKGIYINFSNQSQVYTISDNRDDWETWVIPTLGLKTIGARLGKNIQSHINITFFSSETISVDNIIAGYTKDVYGKIDGDIHYIDLFINNIPSNAKCVVISNRIANLSNPTVSLRYIYTTQEYADVKKAEALMALEKSENTIDSQLVSINGDISDIETKLKYSGIYQADNAVPKFASYTALIAAYDALMAAHPGMITKSDLGVSSSNNYHLYEYTIDGGSTFGVYNSRGRRSPRDAGINKPVFMLMAGIHGYEPGAVMSLYAVISDLVSPMPMLGRLRDNATIKFIPCINPYGFDNNCRDNANAVDLNRNFATDNWYDNKNDTNTAFVPDEQNPNVNTNFNSYWSGAAAASELETQIVQNWLTSAVAGTNVPKFFIDLHNSSYVNEICCLGADVTNASQLLQDSENSFKKQFLVAVNSINSYLVYRYGLVEGIGDDAIRFGYTFSINTEGSSSVYQITKKELIGGILETPERLSLTEERGNLKVIRIGAEVIASILLRLVDYFSIAKI